MVNDQESPHTALEHLRQLSWGNQMLWMLTALFQLSEQLQLLAKVVTDSKQQQQNDKWGKR